MAAGLAIPRVEPALAETEFVAWSPEIPAANDLVESATYLAQYKIKSAKPLARAGESCSSLLLANSSLILATVLIIRKFKQKDFF